MYDNAEQRATTLAQYIIRNKATVREAAAWSGVSKSTVHTDVTVRLEELDTDLCCQVRTILDENKAQRHLRGGLATRELWKKRKE